MTLAWAIERALARNPELQAAESRWRSMLERTPQAGALPDPAITVRYHNEDWGVTYGDSDFSFLEVGVEQELPFWGKRALRRNLAAREADRERAMRDMTALLVAARVGTRYAELVALERTDLALTESAAVLDEGPQQIADTCGCSENGVAQRPQAQRGTHRCN
ncbi:MAG: hypothetical protein DCC71_03670, partial [Proteobacteria bacterium]